MNDRDRRTTETETTSEVVEETPTETEVTETTEVVEETLPPAEPDPDGLDDPDDEGDDEPDDATRRRR